MILLILTFLLAAILAIYGVPIARRAALKFGIVDSPDGRLKHQREPVPYLGGLAIYLSFLVSLAFTFEFRHDVLGIVLAGTLVVMLGLIDDFGVLSPGAKLAGQCLAVFVLIKSGIRIEIASLPDWVDIALTVLWMIGIINAFNLLDIMDGLSAGVGVISAAFLCVVAILNGDQRRLHVGCADGQSPGISSLQLETGVDLHGRLRGVIHRADARRIVDDREIHGRACRLAADAGIDFGHAHLRHAFRHVHPVFARPPDLSRQS